MTERADRLAVGSGGWELASWYLMRLSGILLFGLALGHWVIMHVLHGVEAIDSLFVLNRLANPIWQVYDWLLLTLALLHGWNGLRIIIDDYVHAPAWRMTLQSVVSIVIFLAFVVGSVVIWAA
jgi:succinate dehydrogenase / fumarate reductase membrane anchor subunit